MFWPSLLYFTATLPTFISNLTLSTYLKTHRVRAQYNITVWNKYTNYSAEGAANMVMVPKNYSVLGVDTLSAAEKGYIMHKLVKAIHEISPISDNTTQLNNKLLQSAVGDLCIPDVTCSEDVTSSKYRTIDGSCNNMKHPEWGHIGRAEKRLLPAYYHDGVGEPVVNGVDGHPLPSPRLISNVLHRPDVEKPRDTQATVMVMTFGQVLDHDMVLTPLTEKAADGTKLDCCRKNMGYGAGPLRTCYPIDIPEGDSHFRPQRCMNLVRSAPAICDKCEICQRVQINDVTSYIDASHVYGSTTERCTNLRSFKNGMLKVGAGKDLLPPGPSGSCKLQRGGKFCFFAGDTRVNVVPSLSAIHTSFVREHNRISGNLTTINAHWDDEKLFHETRRIMIALMQHIVYDEYLPIVLGDATMTKYGLKVSQEPYSDVYNDSVDTRISVSFGAASFRFAHASIPDNQISMNETYQISRNEPIEETYKTTNMTFTQCDGITRWMVHDTAVKTDGIFLDGVRNLLFLDHVTNKSLDLASVDIQRCRDHGLPVYNKWRQYCQLPVITEEQFNTPGTAMGNFTVKVADKIRKVYRHPDDIELFPGAMTETTLPGAQVGPTFACLLGEEFRRLKIGDRFYYENPPYKGRPLVAFTKDQLITIKGLKFSKLLCESSFSPHIQTHALQPPNSTTNPMRLCSELADIDLSKWRDPRPTT